MTINSSKGLLAAAKQMELNEKRAVSIAQQEAQMHQEPKATKLNQESIFKAWQVISPAGHSVLTKSQVLDNLRLIFPKLSASEVRELVGTGNLSLTKLNKLLLEGGSTQGVDPNAEAFKILDPQGSGFVEIGAVRKLLQQMPGMEKLDDADLDLVMQLCDADKDGRMCFKDFTTIGSWAPVKEQTTDFTRKLMLEKLKEAKGLRREDDD